MCPYLVKCKEKNILKTSAAKHRAHECESEQPSIFSAAENNSETRSGEDSNVECASLQTGPSVKADGVTLGGQSAWQCEHPKKYIRKDLKEMLCEQFGNSEFIIILRRAVSVQVIPTMLENTVFYYEIGDALDGCLFSTVDCSYK